MAPVFKNIHSMRSNFRLSADGTAAVLTFATELEGDFVVHLSRDDAEALTRKLTAELTPRSQPSGHQ
jgi:hypothetical protein